MTRYQIGKVILWVISRIKAGHVANTNFKDGGFMKDGGGGDRTLPKIKDKGQPNNYKENEVMKTFGFEKQNSCCVSLKIQCM